MTPLDKLLQAADRVWDAHGIFIQMGGGSWARHLSPAIHELHRTTQQIRKTRQVNDDAFRYTLARALYEMFEMRTSRPWDEVGDETCYPDMHHTWLGCADDLIERMTADETG